MTLISEPFRIDPSQPQHSHYARAGTYVVVIVIDGARYWADTMRIGD